MVISHPVNLFPLDSRAKKHLMIAGGIGITPFLAQIAQLDGVGWQVRAALFGAHRQPWRLHGPACAGSMASRVHVYFDDQKAADRPGHAAENPAAGHASLCLRPEGHDQLGPSTAEGDGLARACGAFRRIPCPAGGQALRCASGGFGQDHHRRHHQSLLEAIEAAGVDAPYLCRGGACGQCETDVLGCDGHIEHSDHWLTPEQKAEGKKIMPCVSRFEGKTLVLDR